MPFSANEVTDIKMPHRGINSNLGSILQLFVSHSDLRHICTTVTMAILNVLWIYLGKKIN